MRVKNSFSSFKFRCPKEKGQGLIFQIPTPCLVLSPEFKKPLLKTCKPSYFTGLSEVTLDFEEHSDKNAKLVKTLPCQYQGKAFA